ncbi:OmpA family protein [Paracrocinitomix mangrovi]|uniref:OmpA family protein n=1 Tax=Paracrocinitomix mangrovi TaxID=2862509 RepID=UPI001C8DBBA7|nr:OmpA family protein [Paracrocinitomix mangrovi]UKN02365.1 OmpA family protein [Paracrocinitomix mangrovi]
MNSLKLLTLLIGLYAAQLFGQTYEVVSVEIVCTPKKIEQFNTKAAEFSPFVHDNIIYFTSGREYDMFNFGENNWNRGGYLNMFKAEMKGDVDENVKFKSSTIISNKLMTNNHTGPLCMSVTGDTMFFTQVKPVENTKKNKKKYKPQLYMSVKVDDNWQDPVALPFNDAAYSFGHPAFDSYKGRLYFASDIQGTKGGKDIFYADLKNGSWVTPQALESVNTTSNELYPYVVDGCIFFSSDRANGQGELDIYWQDIKNAGEVEILNGINSPEDDFGIFVFPGMNKGFYSNNSSGNDDIHFFNMDKQTTVRNVLAGNFTYRNIEGTVSGLNVMIIGEDDEIILETTTDSKGDFIFNNIDYDGDYRIETRSEEELYLTFYDENGNPVTKLVSDENGSFTYKKLGYDKGGTLALIPEDMIDVELNKGHLTGQFIYEKIPGDYPDKLRVLLVDEDGNMKFETFTDKNGNFDFRNLDMEENYILTVPENDDDLVLLIFDKKGNVVAQLKSDPKGDFTYRKLSPSYSNSLKVLQEDEDVFELETKTISGYFEYKNIQGNFEGGLTVQAYTENGILIEETKTDAQGKFRFRSLPLEDNLLFKINEDDPNLELDDFTLYIFDRDGKKIAQLRRGQNDFFIYKPLGFESANNLNQIEEDSIDVNISIKTDYDLVVVYFDSNKSNAKSSDLSKLNNMVKLLKSNPSLKIEVNAYADARSSDEYNLILSGKRGDWVVDYCVKKGISKNRFIVNAYGETQLVDENNDALNRRAEIRIY